MVILVHPVSEFLVIIELNIDVVSIFKCYQVHSFLHFILDIDSLELLRLENYGVINLEQSIIQVHLV